MRKTMYGLVAGFVLAVVSAHARAVDPPLLLNYQGRLTDAAGDPRNGMFMMTFQVFDAEAAGNPLPSGTPWEETQNVDVADGIFNVLLGGVTPLPAELFDGEPMDDAAGPLCFLEVTVRGETLAPRRRITSVAYALRAGANNIDLANSMAGSGLITKDGVRFIHNFGIDNTFLGVEAGNFKMTGEDNTATGRSALQSNTTGDDNTATGSSPLRGNTTGSRNTATGVNALRLNMTGNNNTATGFDALSNNTTSGGNTAIGRNALLNHITGSNNVAVGFGAGALHETGNANIYVNYVGVATESNTIRIGTQGTQTARSLPESRTRNSRV